MTLLQPSLTSPLLIEQTWHQQPKVQTLKAKQSHALALYQLTLDTPDKKAFESFANSLANGQTIGTQTVSDQERLAPWCAKLIDCFDPKPVANATNQWQASFVVAYPKAIVESDIGTLQTVLFGKCSMSGALRWQDVWVPTSVIAAWKSDTALGANGIRQKLGQCNTQKALLMAIFKPCLGESPQRLADLLTHQAMAGTHLVKDDEVISDTSLESALARLKVCQEALALFSQQTGKKPPLYAFNLTGAAHTLLERADTLVANGATAFLFNYLTYGLPLLNSLRQQLGSKALLIGHPALGGAFYGSSQHGISPALLFGTLPRLAGADAVLFPSPYGSVCLPLADALAVHDALTRANETLPTLFSVPSAGIKASMVPQILADFGTVNTIINAGTGIMTHEQGNNAGATAFLSQMGY
jgi:2,3-diketo-5-methylthiopentyl-1-phosphate enolase